MVTWIAMNLGCQEMANLAYIEGNVDVLGFGLGHFVHAHILREEPDHSLSMMYGPKAIQLPNPGIRLYFCESLTLQFDRMGEACQSFTRPRTHGQARMEAAQQTTTRLQAHPHEPQWDTGYGGGYSVYHESGSHYPSVGYHEPERPSLPGTLIGMPLWSDTSVMGLTRLST
jgi:hypothetical protein